MNKKRVATLSGVLALVALTTAAVLPSGAQEEPPPPIAIEMLTPRSTFIDDVDLGVRLKLPGTSREVIKVKEPSRTLVARITIQPGARFPWHTHSGPVFVNVVEGELVYVQASDCVEHSYGMGKAFIDPGRGNVHTAFNPTSDVTVLIATFFELSETGPLTITEGVEPGDC